jgi:hypothetical protein
MKQTTATACKRKLRMLLRHLKHESKEYIHLSNPVELGNCRIWAICLSPFDQIYLMNQDGDWYPLEETDRYYEQVINNLLLKLGEVQKETEAIVVKTYQQSRGVRLVA